ncbi:MAG: large-conductance mechanosensitive channel protein MscL [Clostridiales bacterium]
MKGIINEFKTFIARGNVVDLAVGIIIGTAFTAIVNALVQGIFMPVIGILVGGVNFTDLKLVLKPAAADVAEVAIAYGDFIQQVINFLIIAFVVFMMVKFINRFKKKQEECPAPAPAPPAPSDEALLLTEIRDLLKENKSR